MFDRDGPPCRRAVREVSAGVVSYSKAALVLQLEDGHCGELLGQRCDAEPGSGQVRRVALGVREAERGPKDNAAALRDQDGAAEVTAPG